MDLDCGKDLLEKKKNSDACFCVQLFIWEKFAHSGKFPLQMNFNLIIIFNRF